MYLLLLLLLIAIIMSDEDEVQIINEPTIWEVKKVVDKRNNPVTGQIEYLLEWKNWTGPPTWEPKSNCDCTALIKKFERQNSSTRTNSRSLRPRYRIRQAKKRQNILLSSSSSRSSSRATSKDTPLPRARSPEVRDSCCDSSCSDAGDEIAERNDDLNLANELKARKLLLKEIVGAIKGDDILLIVKWHGIANLEKVPIDVVRKFYCQDVLDFLLANLHWKESTS